MPAVEIIANSDQQLGLEFNCNQEDLFVRGARPLQLKFHLAMLARNSENRNFIIH